MTDLEMTKLCAEAMGYEIIDDFSDVRPPMREVDVVPPDTDTSFVIRGEPLRYAPLRDDAQAMALVKRFSLQIHHHGCADARASLVTIQGKWLYAQNFEVCRDDLNRAIVECCARMQASKQETPSVSEHGEVISK